MKSKKNKQIKSGKHLYYSKYLLLASIFLFFILVVLFFIQFVNFNFIKNHFEEPYSFEIKDECSLILGNLVHQIRDKTDCELRCYTSCNSFEDKYIESEFSILEGGCNSCTCSCK